MKAGWIVAIVAVPIVSVGGFLLYRAMTPPKLEFIDQDNLNHSGQFVFNGVTQSYGNGSALMAGRNGWDLKYDINADGTTTFTLVKNGVAQKQLAVK